MANVGPIEALKYTAKGDKLWITIGGQRYLCKDLSIATLQQGTVISYEPYSWTTDKGERMYGITKWSTTGAMGGLPIAETVNPGENPSVVAQRVLPKPNGPDADAVMRYCSNVVGQACRAGTITHPNQIRDWYKGAKDSLKEVPSLDELGPDSDIPGF